jgi:branched-chain amino acid transport system ATP-binding protein
MLMVEHNLDVAFRLAEWATVLAAGRVIADGPLEVVRANDEVRRLYLGRMLGNEGRSSTHT